MQAQDVCVMHYSKRRPLLSLAHKAGQSGMHWVRHAVPVVGRLLGHCFHNFLHSLADPTGLGPSDHGNLITLATMYGRESVPELS